MKRIKIKKPLFLALNFRALGRALTCDGLIQQLKNVVMHFGVCCQEANPNKREISSWEDNFILALIKMECLMVPKIKSLTYIFRSVITLHYEVCVPRPDIFPFIRPRLVGCFPIIFRPCDPIHERSTLIESQFLCVQKTLTYPSIRKLI